MLRPLAGRHRPAPTRTAAPPSPALRRLTSATLLTALALATVPLAGAAAMPSLTAGPTSGPADKPAAGVRAASTPTPAPATPSRARDLGPAIELPAAYVPATSCDEQAKPGTVALAALLRRTYRGTSTAITRPCGTDALPTTEHYDGRAVDWFASARRPESLAQAESAVAWLTGPDEQGVPAGNARRLGVMYLIWNDRIWSSYRLSEGWRPYSGCAARPDPRLDTPCHRDHVHVSLSWEGAMGRTSWWTGRVASRDFGPCRTPDLTWAEPYAAPRARPCPVLPRPATPAGATPLLGALMRYSGLPLGPGSRNPAVRVLQQAVGTAATGRFDTATGQALTDWQRGHGVTPTGRTDPATWRALLAANQPAPR